MKLIFSIFIVLLCNFAFSQSTIQQDNKFVQSEQGVTTSSSGKIINTSDALAKKGNGANPADPVPVDQYIPLLLLTAVGMIIAYNLRRKVVK